MVEVVVVGFGSVGSQATTAAIVHIASAALAASLRDSGSTATKNVAYKRVAGIDPNLLSFDYYRPTLPRGCGPAPIVVYVHGGGFRIGDKSNEVSDKVKLFTGEGWVFASLNYRLSPQPPNNLPGQIRYPAHEQDVAAALARDFSSALNRGGTPASVIDVSPLNHEEINQAVGAKGDTEVTSPLMSFLRSCA